MLRGAASVHDVLADPIGRYFAGESFLVWFHHKLAGAFVFGQLHPNDYVHVQQLLVTRVLECPYDLLLDLAAVEVFDERAFALLEGFLATNARLLAGLRRLALVRPRGLAGSAIVGLFYDRVSSRVDAAIFTDRAEAMSWLGHDPAAPERTDVDEVIAKFHHVSPLLRRLRGWLVREVADATLASAARWLGTSERSLQRQLTESNTTFRDELAHARIRAAEALLGSDDKIDTIARRLGYGSGSSFTTLFSRVVGESPEEFRRRRRATRTSP